MSRFGDMIRCDGCGVEIILSPVKIGEHLYCCLDCSQGIACNCGALMEQDDYEEDPTRKEVFSEF